MLLAHLKSVRLYIFSLNTNIRSIGRMDERIFDISEGVNYQLPDFTPILIVFGSTKGSIYK